MRVRSQVDRIDDGLDQEQRERRAEHRQWADRISIEIESLRQVVRQGAEQAEEVDARALPVVIIALFLTTFAENLSQNVVSGVVAALSGLGVLIYAARLVIKARPLEPVK